MKSLILLTTLSISVAFAQANNSLDAQCSQKMKTVLEQIQQAEAQNSSGQIEPCIPAKDKNKTTKQLFQSLMEAKKAFDVANGKYQALEQKFALVAQHSASGEGHICGAPENIKAAVKRVNAELQQAETELTGSYSSFQQTKASFEQQYKGRWRQPESFMPSRMPPNCRDTQRRVKAVLAGLQQAGDQCASNLKKVRESSGSLGELNSVLGRGCQKGKPRCEAVPLAGTRSSYNYGIDFYDEYGTLVDSKEYATNTLEKRNNALERIRGCCEYTDAPDKCLK